MTYSAGRRAAGLHALVGVALMSLGTSFAATPATDKSNLREPVDGLEEVVVRGLRDLRRAAIKAEDRMLARYNELNRDRDLDIVCSTRTRTGGHFSQRYCKLRLQERVEERDAWSFMTAMTRQDVQAGAGGASPAVTPLAEVRVELMARADDFRNNVTKLLEDNPELRELVHQASLASQRYDDRLKRDKGDRAPSE